MLTAAMNAAGTVVVLVIMAVILADVLGRALFARPLAGTAEIVSMSIAAIVFLQFPGTLRAGRVIAADGLLAWAGRRSIRLEQWLLAAWHVLGGAMFAVVTVYVWPLLRRAVATGDHYGNFGVFTFPKWPVLSVILFGCAVMTVQYLVLGWQYWRAGRARRRLREPDPSATLLS